MDHLTVLSIWRQPERPGVKACVSLEVVGGQKTYLRVWSDPTTEPEWGWVKHETAVRVWPVSF